MLRQRTVGMIAIACPREIERIGPRTALRARTSLAPRGARHQTPRCLDSVFPAPRPRVSLIAFLRRTPSAGLLLVQLAGVLLYPWMESSPRGRALLAAFG